MTDIDPGLNVQSTAIELGLVAEHSVLLDSRKSASSYDRQEIMRSRVICAPSGGEAVFEPDALQDILASVLPSDEEYKRTTSERSRFPERGILILPLQTLYRKVGSCSLTSLIEIEGEEPQTAHKTQDLYAETIVLISPSERYIQHLHMSGFVYRNFLNDDETKLFKKAARRELSLWDRIK